MADIKMYRVFCAAPGDLNEEREQLRTLISRLNDVHYKRKPYRLEYVGWDMDVISQYGVDPQQAINEQLGQTFEIFILMLWKRIGSATPRAISGTIEELMLATKRWEITKFPKIGIFFKTDSINHWDQDISQLDGLHQIKDKLKDKTLIKFFRGEHFTRDAEQFLAHHVEALTQERHDVEGVPRGPVIIK